MPEINLISSKKRYLDSYDHKVKLFQNSSDNEYDFKKQKLDIKTLPQGTRLVQLKDGVNSINIKIKSGNQNVSMKRKCSDGQNSFELCQTSISDNCFSKKQKSVNKKLSAQTAFSGPTNEVLCDSTPIFSNKIKTVEKNPVQNISKFHKSMKYIIQQCKICFEAWPILKEKIS